MNKESANSVHLAELIPAVDKAAKEAWPEIYIEVHAKTGHRTSKSKNVVANEAPPIDNESEQPSGDNIELP